MALQKALGDRAVACNVPDGYLRVSPYWPNALDEIDYVVESVEACVVAAPGQTGQTGQAGGG